MTGKLFSEPMTLGQKRKAGWEMRSHVFQVREYEPTQILSATIMGCSEGKSVKSASAQAGKTVSVRHSRSNFRNR